MRTEKDFKEFIGLLNRHSVKYLIIGGFAYSYYAEPRYTKDIDIFIKASEDNAEAIIRVLADFGFENMGLTKEDFLVNGQIIQLGIEPVRIDILNCIAGVDFDSAWVNRTNGRYGDISANFISREDLIKTKKATGRKQDLADLENLI